VIRTLDPAEVVRRAGEFAALNVAVVEAGAPILFVDGVTPAKAEAYWSDPARHAGKAVVVAEADGRLIGTATLAPYDLEMVRHRGEVTRVMVHPEARGRGVGQALMQALDEEARKAACPILHLFAEDGGAGARLYERCGWLKVGTIPDEMALPNGTLVPGAVYWKRVV
jgi:GNAT superfamily N-acetyltransferase